VLSAHGCTTDARQASRPAGCPTLADMSAGLPATPAWRTNPALADVDGDGYLDVAATTRKGEPPGVFLFRAPDRWIRSSEGISLDMQPCGIGVDLVDVTGDGLRDLLVADHCTGLYLFRGDGKGGWTRLAHLRHPSGEGFNDVVAGDVDGDGRVDLVALAAFTTGFTVYLQTEAGTFVPQETTLPRSGYGYELGLADLDGDGVPDLYTSLQWLSQRHRERGVKEAKVWLQRPAGLWEPVQGLPESGGFYGVARGDLDEDGVVDLVLSGMDGQGILLFFGIGAGTWRPASPPHPGQAPDRAFAGVALADLDRDGHLDMVAVQHRPAAIVIWLGDGSGGFSQCPPPHPPLPRAFDPGWGIAVGDINRDGYPDIVAGFGSDGGGALRAWALVAGPTSR
jgi:hypothetical protein